MTAPRRPNQAASSLQLPLTVLVFIVMSTLVFYVAFAPDAGEGPIPTSADLSQALEQKQYKQVARQAEQRLRSTVKQTVRHKREQLQKALDSLTTSAMPGRLRLLRDKHQIVGERLSDIKAGTETVQEVLNAGSNPSLVEINDKPPMELDEIIDYLTNWIHTLHDTLSQHKRATYEGIWQAYHDLAVKTLYVWDREYLSRMPSRRDDGSIYLSLATYRDENCLNTIKWAYEKAKNPEKLFVGLVQQNCHKDCKSGILEGGKVEDVPPDENCYELFCQGEGKQYCAKGQVRVLDIDEPESLGPYAARYFASKMWYGEQWFMQTDAHMTFKQDWDAISVDMLQKAPSKKPVLSHYPPSSMADLEKMATEPASRLCGPIFATSDLEAQIIRLEGGTVSANAMVDCLLNACPHVL